MKEFLILFAQSHETFRLAELEAVADMFNIDVDLSDHSLDRPYMVMKLESCDLAAKFIERTILCRAVYELYGSGHDLEALHKDVQSKYNREYWLQQFGHDSFKFEINSFKGTRSQDNRVEVIESFSYMDLPGPIRLKKPQHLFAVLEDWEPYAEKPNHMWFGRFLSDTQRRSIDGYDLKKRRYIGTTSFDAELATMTCSIAQLAPGKFMYDPFAGTGSFLIGGGHFGAITVGSDIDGRMLKGKGKATIPANFKQYGLGRFLDVLTMDFTHNTLRDDIKFDAIVCDPPYGVREGLKVLGAKDPEKFKDKEKVEINGIPAHLNKDYIHPKKPYAFNSLLDDLLQYAADHLVEKGRLCFWMPTATSDYKETDIPQHPDLVMNANCEQDFNKWSRRLLVYTRRRYGEKGDYVPVKHNNNEEFRNKYFRRFE